MPAFSDILQFMRGQLLQTPTLPNTSFAGKTVVITGANTGLGFESAKQLVQLNVSNLILGCRSLSKGEAAKEKILASVGKKSKTEVEVQQIDMASFDSVKAFVSRLQEDNVHLDAVIANAGISTNQFSLAEGYESTLTVNVISTFLFSLLVLPMLERTAKQTRAPTHLAIVGSNVHAFADHTRLQAAAPGAVFRTLTDEGNEEEKMAGQYFLSKLLVMQNVQELAKRIPRSSEKNNELIVIVSNVSPGWCKTELFRQDDGGFMGRNMLRLIGRSSEHGGRTLTSAVAAGKETHGQYVSECRVKNTSVFVRSPEGQRLARQNWEELVGILEGIEPGVSRVLV